uniref:Uncharacterized protein n=1 Tax=Geoglobus ahangari TaxID=113653 RepID=A0A7C4S8E6_9EURY
MRLSLNFILWITKIATGLLLIPAVILHLVSTHFQTDYIPDETLYTTLLILLFLHLLAAIRDLLVEMELGKAVRYSLLLLLLSALLIPVFSEGNRLENFANTTLADGECVKDSKWMRYNHALLLIQWRDEVVREGNRTLPNYEEKGFKTCYICHSYKYFCSDCHQKIGVKPKCFDCHITPQR